MGLLSRNTQLGASSGCTFHTTRQLSFQVLFSFVGSSLLDLVDGYLLCCLFSASTVLRSQPTLISLSVTSASHCFFTLWNARPRSCDDPLPPASYYRPGEPLVLSLFQERLPLAVLPVAPPDGRALSVLPTALWLSW